MNKKIFRLTALTSFFVLSVSIILITCVLFGVFERQIISELKSETDMISFAVESRGTDFFDDFENDDKRITLIAPDGRVLADSAEEASLLSNHADRKEIAQALKEGSGSSVRYSDTLMKKTIYYAQRMSDGNVLRISTLENSAAAVFLDFMPYILAVFAISLAISFLLSKRVSRSIINPINSLDLENPDNNKTYEELTPLLGKISSQKKTIDAQIAQQEKNEQFRREFTTNVSHELKTPLTSISGFAEIMKGGDTPPEITADFSKSIYDEAQRLISLVNDIIKISEFDEKSIRYEEENIDLREICQEALNRLAPSAEKKRVSINLTGKCAQIYGVRSIIEEMIFNLCDNAIKYNKVGGSVDINIDSGKDIVSVTVKDTGIGIPDASHSRVFERFYRVDKGRSKVVGGTGLGLSIVKHGAMYHNAEINLESKEGEGTSITIVFSKTP